MRPKKYQQDEENKGVKIKEIKMRLQKKSTNGLEKALTDLIGWRNLCYKTPFFRHFLNLTVFIVRQPLKTKYKLKLGNAFCFFDQIEMEIDKRTVLVHKIGPNVFFFLTVLFLTQVSLGWKKSLINQLQTKNLLFSVNCFVQSFFGWWKILSIVFF